MKKLKSSIAMLLAMGFLSATLFTACGGKKEEKVEETTEHPADSTEHPADEGEHPMEDSTATDSTASA
jgi:hypothetical protein